MSRSTRSYVKSWQDKRPGWTRRVRWYEGIIGDDLPTIRLEFTDTERRRNRFFTDRDEAQTAYDTFIEGTMPA